MMKSSQYETEKKCCVHIPASFSAKEHFPDITSTQAFLRAEKNDSARGFHKRASIIHLVNVLTWTALVSTEVKSGQKKKLLRNWIWGEKKNTDMKEK